MLESRSAEGYRSSAWLLFWPLFGIRYLLIENCRPSVVFHPVHCFLDDRIPFLEWFVMPYLFWHVCIIGMHLWLYLKNDPAYVPYSKYLIVSMGISTIIFLVYPTCQNLRPAVFLRENLLTDVVRLIYRMDTNTNVCPSEHVIGSVGFFLAAWYSDCFHHSGKIKWIGVTAFLTAVATVFLKQHSVLDVAAALPVCAAGWMVAFHRRGGIRHGPCPYRIPFGGSSA